MPDDRNAWPGMTWVWLTWLLSLITVLGSLSLTLLAGLKPCPLCFYQRAFAMAVLGTLTLGILTRGRPRKLLPIVTPVVTGGLGVAVFHVYLEVSKTLDCPKGLFGLGTAPQQSLLMYVLLTLAVVGGIRFARVKPFLLVTGTIVGVVLAIFSCISNGALPTQPNPKFDDDGNRVIIGCEPHWNESMEK